MTSYETVQVSTHVFPSLHWLVTVSALAVSRVAGGDHVDVIRQLRQGGEDKHHGWENDHSHGGEGINLNSC